MRPDPKEQPGSVQRVVGLLPPLRDKRYAYRMGFDAGKNGANTTNCAFSIFSSKENTHEWERGYEAAKQKANAQAQARRATDAH